ncbi:WD repeat-containing protein 87 [Rhizophlyctis rosea]|nr:WD repeat-containing protein 87 [Rhizophlyctis rosea]
MSMPSTPQPYPDPNRHNEDSILMPPTTNNPIQPARPILAQLQSLLTSPLPPSPLLIPHGFQLSRTIPHPNPSLRSVLFIPGSGAERFVTLDRRFVWKWRDNAKEVRLDTKEVVGVGVLMGDEKRGREGKGVEGLCRWIWVAKWKCFIVGTDGLELKTLDLNFAELTSTSSVKPVLSLEFNDAAEELIAAGVGSIMVWRFRKVAESSRMMYYFSEKPRLDVKDLKDDDWVSYTCLHRAWNRLYAAVNNSVMIYDYETGERTDTLRDIHDLSITAMVFHSGMEYLVTASRDSTIKVWNRHNHILHNLHDHSNSVTGLAIIPTEAIYGRSGTSAVSTPASRPTTQLGTMRGAVALMLSCSLDGTIRMWNLESGHCTYRLETSSECLGIGWMRWDTFYHFARDGVFVWNLNRYWSTFAYLRSSITHIRRADCPGVPSRIVTVAEDGSIRLLSPVTGAVLTTGFPIISDIGIVDVVYDIAQDRIWLLSKNGDIALYDTQRNPCPIVEHWKHVVIEPDPNQTRPYPTVLALIGGTDSGQITMIDVRYRGRQEIVVQAHTAEITAVACDTRTMKFFSAGKDCTIKIWSIAIPTIAQGNPLSMLENKTPFGAALWNASKAMPTMTLSLVGTVQVEDSTPVQRMWFNSLFGFLVVTTGEGRGLFVWKVGEGGVEGAVRKHPRDDDHSAAVKGLACLDTLKIFATAGEDRIVKVWDQTDNSLIREIQFAEPLQSIAFANARADLLVGMSDQVALVRMQDYIPNSHLAAVIESPEAWTDDLVETSRMFDSNLDFWALYRDLLRDRGIEWHVQEKPTVEEEEATSALQQLERKHDEYTEQRREYIRQVQNREAQERALRTSMLEGITVLHDWDGTAIATGEGITITREMVGSRGGQRPATVVEEEPDSFARTESEQVLADIAATWAEHHRAGARTPTEGRDQDGGRYRTRRIYSRGGTGTPGSRRQSYGLLDVGAAGYDGYEEGNGGFRASQYSARRRSGGYSAGGRSSTVANEGPPGYGNTRRRSIYPQALRAPNIRIQEPARPAPSSPTPSARHRQQLILDKAENLEMRGSEVQARLDRQKEEEQRARKENEPKQITVSMGSRKGAVQRRLAALGMLPNSVVAAEVAPAALEKKKVEIERSRKKKEEDDKAKHDQVWEKVSRKLEKRKVVAAERAAAAAAAGDGPSHAEVTGVEEEGEPPPLSEAEKKALAAKRDALTAAAKAEAAAKAAKVQAAASAKAKEVAEAAAKVQADAVAKAAAAEEAAAEDIAQKRATELMAQASERFLKSREGKTPMTGTTFEERLLSEPTPEEISFATVTVQEARTGVPMTDFGPTKETVVEYHAPAPAKERPPPPNERQTLPEMRDVIGAEAPRPKPRRRQPQPAPVAPKPPQTTGPPRPHIPIKRPAPPLPASKVTTIAMPETPPTPPVPKPVGLTFGFEIEGIAPPEDQAKISWGLFSQAVAQKVEGKVGASRMNLKEIRVVQREEGVTDELRSIMGKFWFPGLGDKEVTLQNIVRVLFDLLKKGQWAERVEASKSLLYLYRTFDRDFRSPLEDIVLPQIEMAEDENWQVRATVVKNLVAYGVYSLEIVHALVRRLVDEHEEVR